MAQPHAYDRQIGNADCVPQARKAVSADCVARDCGKGQERGGVQTARFAAEREIQFHADVQPRPVGA